MPPMQSAPAVAPRGARLLPDFCSLPMVLAVVVYGELLAILLTLASPRSLATFWIRLGPLSVLVQMVVLLVAIVLCLGRRLPFGAFGARAKALLAWLVIPATAGAVALAAMIWLPPEMALLLFPEDGAPGLLLRALAIGAIVGALLLRYLYLHQQWRGQVETLANARLQTLQARIRPHFLFNSMNAIASLTRTDPRLAEEIVVDLADLFRAALATDQQTATLAEELDLARRYLNIERQRLGERLRVEWELDADLPLEARLPPLILQPLVENAVYHGIQSATAPGCVRIGARYRHGRIALTLRNSLPEVPLSVARVQKGNRMALDNVRQRMEAMFPGSARVRHVRGEREYLVRLVFPFPWSKR